MANNNTIKPFDHDTNAIPPGDLSTQRASSLLNQQQNLGNDIQTDKNKAVKGLATASTNISIICNNRVIGMIQSFNISEQRNVTKLQSIGVEGVIQAVPGNTNGGSIQAQRVALYGERIYDALGMTDWNAHDPSGFKKIFSTLKDQRVPFEIRVQTKQPGTNERYYEEVYQDCWISSYKKSYTVQNITVSEDVTIMYADVSDKTNMF